MTRFRVTQWALVMAIVGAWFMPPAWTLAQRPTQPAQPQPQPTQPEQPTQPKPEPLHIPGGTTEHFGLEPKEPEKPPHELEWLPLDKELADATATARPDVAKQLEVTAKLIGYAGKWGLESKHFGEVFNALPPIYRRIDKSEHVEEAFKQTNQLLKVVGEKVSAADMAEPLKTFVYSLQLGLHAIRAGLATGPEKQQRYREALALTGVLLGRELPLALFKNVHETFGALMWRLRRMDELLERTKALLEAEKDPDRRLALLAMRVQWFERGAKWDEQLKFIETLENELSDPRKRAVYIGVLSAKAKAHVMLEQEDEFAETLTKLRGLGRDGSAAADELRQWVYRRPGIELPSFYLRDLTEEQTDHELEEYFERPTMYVLWRASSRESMELVREIVRRVLPRYSATLLNVVLIGDGRGGETAAEQLKALQTMAWPRGMETALFDSRGTVAKALRVTNFPQVVLADREGKLIFASSVVDNFGSAFGVLANLELLLELSEEGKAITIDDRNTPEDTPEYKMLKRLLELVDLKADHPARKANSVKAAAIHLGEEGRRTVVTRIQSLQLNATTSAEDKATLRKLRELLR